MTEVKAEPVVNREDDSLPYAYFNPETEGKLTWVCGQNQDGKITSVFCMDLGTHKDKKCEYLPDIEKARWVREELVKAGWQKLRPPEVTFTFPGEKEPRNLSRKEKRYLQRKMKKMQKQNPFTDDQPPPNEGEGSSGASGGYDLDVTPQNPDSSQG